MVLAQKKHAMNQANDLSNDFNRGKKTIKRRRPSVSLKKGHIVSLVICAFCLGIILTAQYAKIAAAGFQVVQLKQEIAKMETANERLQLEILQAQSLNRVEHIAINDLGMIYSDREQKQQLAIQQNKILGTEPYIADSGNVRSNTITIQQREGQQNPIIQAVSQIIRLSQ